MAEAGRGRLRLPGMPGLPGLIAALGGVLLLLGLAAGVADALAQPVKGQADREYQLHFSGNRAFSQERLRKAAAEELDSLGISEFPAAVADDAAFLMEQAYKREGYAFATVSYRLIEGKESAVLEFTASEGKQVFVAAIEFSGNSAFSSEELLTFFAGYGSGFLGVGRQPFVEQNIRDGLDEVRNLYLGEGYPQVQVEEPVFRYSEDRGQVTVHCTIREGARRTIASVVFTGDADPEAAKPLDDFAREMLGKPYVPRSRLLLESNVREIYGNLGFPRVGVHVVEKSGGDFSRVALEVSVDGGVRVTIGAVEIRGNERTDASFIRGRLTMRPGDIYNAGQKQASFARLYQTGLFSRVSIELTEGVAPGEGVLVVTVQEVMGRELFVHGGWGSYEMLRGSVGYQDNNLRGTGRIFRFETGGSVKGAGVQVNVTDPWFLGSDITADLPVYFRRREEPSFTREERGASLLFSRNFPDRLAVTLGYLYRENNILDIASSSLAEAAERDYTSGSLKLQATIDSRNDLFFPTSGHRGFAAAEVADPSLGSGISFYRFNLGLRKFLPFGDKNTMGLRYDTGVILPGRNQLTIPIGERFFNGGENTVRSFKESQLGPRDAQGEAMGGDAFNVVGVELRRMLTERLAGSVFFDYGNVSPNRTREEMGEPPVTDRSQVIDATLADYFKGFRPGLGCGLLYLLPVGPARLDVAWNPDRDKERGDDEYVIHFSLGAAF